jgi:predicted Zn-dependent peptidase
MSGEHRLTVLDSGLRVVTEAMPSVRSAALGFWIGTGSAAESETDAGLSHLVEHMLFRGTGRYASVEIDQLFDGMGAELNAGTGKESTSVYTRVLDVHLPKAFDAIADMVWRPAMDATLLAAEREIVLEEISMYEDEPQDKVFDVLSGAVFGEHPLGRAVIGHAGVVSATTSEGLTAFHHGRYVPSNVVIAAAGSVDHDALVALAREAEVGGMPPNVPAPVLDAPPAVPASRRFYVKETEQYHLTLGATGITRFDDRRFALRVLDNILGGTSSSRLFQAVRERDGLAYSVYSFQSLFARSGEVGLYLGTRPDNVVKAMSVVAEELDRFRTDGASAAELARSKENVKGRLVLALESTGSRMSRLGASLLGDVPLLTVDELIEQIDAVELEDVQSLAVELFAPERLSAAAVGADESVFRTALEPVSHALAEAA